MNKKYIEKKQPTRSELKVLFEIDFVNTQYIVDSLINGQLKQARDFCNEYVTDYTDYNYDCSIDDMVELQKIVNEKYTD